MIKSIKLFWSMLDQKKRNAFRHNIFFTLFRAIFEILSISLIIPLVSLFFLNDTKYIEFFNFSNFNLDDYSNLKISIFFSFIFLFAFIIKNFFNVLAEYRFNKYIFEIKNYLYAKVLQKFLQSNYLYFIKNTFSKISNTLVADTTIVSNVFAKSLLLIISEIIILLSIFCLFFIFNFNIVFLIVFPIFFVVVFLLKLINKKIKKHSLCKIENNKIALKTNHELFQSIREIFILNEGQSVNNDLINIQKKNNEIERKLLTIYSLPRPILEVLAVISILILIFFLTFQLNFSKEELIIILGFSLVSIYRIIPSLNIIFTNYQLLKTGLPSLKNVDEALKLKDDKINLNKKVKKINFKKKITLKNVSFDYLNGVNVLKNITLDIQKGRKIGVFGDSGSGKSTLLCLLVLLFRPSKGSIYLDNFKISGKQNEKSYQQLFYYIAQDTYLINDTILNNIKPKNIDINLTKLNKILKLTCLDQFINKLPKKLNTHIGFASKEISSGQKQRIALARSLFYEKEILILDEATNALDESMESDILSNYFKHNKKKTILFITHNVKNLKYCDIIYELKDGILKKKKL